MPQGAPDYYMYRPLQGTYAIEDLSEMVARLGAPASYDRRGTVIWVDDFEHGVNKWQHTSLTYGSTLNCDVYRAQFGSHSALLTTHTAANEWARMSHHEPLPPSTVVGFEYRWAIPDEMEALDTEIWYYDGTRRWVYAVRLDLDGDGVQGGYYWYHNPPAPAAWVAWPTYQEHTLAGHHWHIMKLVIDLQAHRYVRALTNDLEVNFAPDPVQNCENAGATGNRYLLYRIRAWNQGTDHADVYVDAAILTIDEPIPFTLPVWDGT